MNLLRFIKNFGKRGADDRAVLIGINAYPSSPLSGCVNDVLTAKDYLLSRGCKAENIHILTDKDATTVAIGGQILWLLQTPPGSRAFFHYSGHGAQIPCVLPGEPDRLSEIICPVDFDWTQTRMITDKQFVEVFSQMKPGVKFNWISDSCHSGDLDRSITGKPRRLLPPPNIQKQVEEITRKGFVSMPKAPLNVGYVSACKSSQTAADAFIGSKHCGAFSHFFFAAAKSMPDSPLNKVVDITSRNLYMARFSQVPQADGSLANQPLF